MIALILGGLESQDVITPSIVALLMIVMVNGIDAAVTYAQAKKGLIALDGALAVVSARGRIIRGSSRPARPEPARRL